MSLEAESVVDSEAVRDVLERGRSRECRLGVGERVIGFSECVGGGGRVWVVVCASVVVRDVYIS